MNSLFQSPPRLVLLSFGIVIAAGTLVLMLPSATVEPGSMPLFDALFTSTSATCVTGLIVRDTGTDFTIFGQIIILILIQAGGLGIMTISTFFMFLVSGRLGILEREVLFDTLSQNPVRNLTRLLIIVFAYTFVIEAVGCTFLTYHFHKSYPAYQSLYLGIFHSVSAFCNAGFSLFSDSFLSYQDNAVINIAVCGLIVLGGLGFVVTFDLFLNRRNVGRHYWRSLSLHSRLVITVTAILIAASTLIFFLLENKNTLYGMPLGRKIIVSLFQAITTRTAGFNSIEIRSLANSTLFVFIILMFIGASPGSCGGGIKTTTFAIFIKSIYSRFRMRDDTNLFLRRIPKATVSKATAIIFFSLFILTLLTLLLMVFELPEVAHTETRGTFLEYVFESISVYGTVGLSMGVTNGLHNAGKVIIVLLMFIGRLGPLTVALALKGKREPKFLYAQENIMVG